MLPLHTLPPEHPANRYLAGRFIDPELVGKFYGVSYCPESKYFLAKNRIIIPIMEGGKLRGWQARHVGDLDWKAEGAPPKYWNAPGMSRADIVYNIDNASRYLTGVVVEGPTDVWSFGPMSMATIGFPPTQQQVRKIITAFRRKNLVFLFDPDITENPRTAELFEALKQTVRGTCARGVAFVQLPSPFDPGDLDREYLRPFVAAEARRQGVSVDWRACKQ
jgi:DNA primase